MSTDTTGPATTPARTFDIAGDEGLPLGRLISVEVRKSFDTRAGRWFTVSILALVLVSVGLAVLAFSDEQQDLVAMLGLSGGILGYFLPVLMILLVTSEWTQRTGLVTFTLEPRRSRVIVAKVCAGLALALAALALGAGIAALGTALSPVNGGESVWNLGVNEIQNFVLTSLVGVLIGFAVAMLLRNSAAAIVAYFVYVFIVPLAGTTLVYLIDGFGPVLPWIEFNTAQQPLFTGDYRATGEEWAQIAVSGTLWLVIPFAIGVWRLVRVEVK